MSFNWRNSYIVRQCIAALACFVESIACGVVMAYTGTLFPQLENDLEFDIDKEDETWIASSAILAMAFGCILGGLSMPHLTRKLIITSTNIGMITGFLTLYFSHNLTFLLLGRVLCGLSMGISRPVIVTIVAEIARPDLRSVFTNLIMLGHVVGALLSDVIATFATWRINSLITCFYSTLAVVIFIVLPETYGSHIGKLKIQAAIDSFHWYRGYDTLSQQEINEIVRTNTQTNLQSSSKLLKSQIKMDAKFFKAFMICSTFFAAGQLNGINVLSLYSVQIFQKLFQDVNANYITIGYDFVKIVTSITSLYAIKRFKLRTLTFISAGGVILSLVFLSSLYYLENNTSDKMEASRYNILTCIVIILYVQFLLCGLAPLPWVTPPELFETHNSSFGSGCTIFLNYIIYFMVVKFSPALLNVSYSLTFGIFAGLTLILTGILWFILPETKNKTLLDAQAMVITN